MVSYNFWKNTLGQNPNVVGLNLRLNNYPFTVVGVTPPGFYGDTVGDVQDVWIPLAMQEQIIAGRHWLNDYQTSWLHLIGRLKPGTTMQQAKTNINLVFKQLLGGPVANKLTSNDLQALKKSSIDVGPGGNGFSQLRGDFTEPLMVLMGFVVLVLFIACVNVANLMLARATARQREIAVRSAIGAAPLRLMRQLLTESLLLAFAGGVAGLLAARWGVRTLLSMSGQVDLEASLDGRVLAFTVIVCLVTGILFGIIPAIRGRRAALTAGLKANSQASTGEHASGWNWGKILVGGQVTLSLLILFGAGLLVRSLQNLRNIDLGYSREHLLLVVTDPMTAGYQDQQVTDFSNELISRMGAIPGVQAVTSSKNGLFSGSESSNSIHVEGFVGKNDDEMQASFDEVGPSYFTALGIPILVGRDISLNDTATSPKVAVVNEAFARFYFGQRNPIGHKFTIDDPRVKNQEVDIVGVVRNSRITEVRKDVQRRFFVPLSQMQTAPAVIFEVRTMGNPVAVSDTIRKLIKDYNPSIPVDSIRTVDERLTSIIRNDIVIARLSTIFAGLALALACIGLYGVMSYSVSGRTREIGVRMALGAQRPDVLWMVLREALKVVLIGVVIGIPAALLGSRLLATTLYGLSTADPRAMAVVIVVLAGVAALASFIPARKATKVDPIVALRYE